MTVNAGAKSSLFDVNLRRLKDDVHKVEMTSNPDVKITSYIDQ